MSGVRKCARKACTMRATCSPVVRVPALGISLAEHEPLVIAAKYSVLCDAHYDTFEVGEVLIPSVRARITRLCKQNGRIKPDFVRSYKERSPL